MYCCVLLDFKVSGGVNGRCRGFYLVEKDVSNLPVTLPTTVCPELLEIPWSGDGKERGGAIEEGGGLRGGGVGDWVCPGCV